MSDPPSCECLTCERLRETRRREQEVVPVPDEEDD